MLKNVCAVLCFSAVSVAQAQTTIEIESEAGDYIGQGKNYSYNETNADILYRRNHDGGISVSIDSLPDSNDSFWWRLALAAPGDEEIKVGVYESAQRFPFQDVDKPGLDFSGSGRGCNSLSGSFEVYEVSYDEDGELESLNVEFEQHCEGKNAALKGTLVFNTYYPLANKTVGLNPTQIICKNKTTGQKIKRKTTELINDCKALGLSIDEGDKVTIKIIGTAQ